MSIFLNLFTSEKKVSYTLNQTVDVVDQTNKLAVAVFNPESMLIETRPFYEIQIKESPAVTPTGLNFFLFDIQKIYFKTIGHFIQVRQKDIKGSSSAYYIDYQKPNQDGVYMIYNYMPRPQKFSEIEAKLLRLSNKLPALHFIAIAYNRHGLAVLGYARIGEIKKYRFFWASPEDKNLNELTCKELVVNQRQEGSHAVVKSLDGFANFNYFNKICYLNNEKAFLIYPS